MEENNEEIVVVTVRVPKSIHEDAKRKMASGGSFQGILLGWLDEWTQGSRPAPRSRPKIQKSTGKDVVWHEKLDFVFQEGTKKDRIGIEQNLEWAEDAISKRQSSRKRAG